MKLWLSISTVSHNQPTSQPPASPPVPSHPSSIPLSTTHISIHLVSSFPLTNHTSIPFHPSIHFLSTLHLSIPFHPSIHPTTPSCHPSTQLSLPNDNSSFTNPDILLFSTIPTFLTHPSSNYSFTHHPPQCLPIYSPIPRFPLRPSLHSPAPLPSLYPSQ